MGSGKETSFENVNESMINAGEATATVSGKLFSEGGVPVEGADVVATLKTPPSKADVTTTATTDSGGGFNAVFKDLNLPQGSYKVDLKFPANADKKLDGASAKTSINVKQLVSSSQGANEMVPALDAEPKDLNLSQTASAGRDDTGKKDRMPPVTYGCDPCTDLISTARRVLRDPKANAAVSEYLQGMADGTTTTTSTKDVLTTFAKAIAGKDAVEACGEGCRAQARIEIWIFDAIRNRVRKLERQELEEIDIWLLEKGDLAAVARTYEDDGIFFPSVVTASTERTENSETTSSANAGKDDEVVVGILFPRDLAQGPVSPTYLTSEPGKREFTNVFVRESRQSTDSKYAPEEQNNSQQLETLPEGWVPKDIKNSTTSRQFEMKVRRGMLTMAKFLILPRAARVRVFSCVEGDPCCLQGSCVDEDCGCSQGACSKEDCSCAKSKQYISKVAITASNEGSFVTCGKTSDSGCVTFKLNPGWYKFSAPEEVKITGCNYTLCSSSPISAYLGANQFCSDLFFCYKKKGTAIEVISEIDYPDPGNPYERARNNLPGVQYLLLREGDPSFAQQQTTTDGSVVRFENVPVGTYLLFCQGPPQGYNSQPPQGNNAQQGSNSQSVEPVYPEEGRMALRVFAGQAHSKIPVSVKFRTSRVTPATLDGFVRDNDGIPVPQQIVQVVNKAGCAVAAGLTDQNGFYSIQLYKADNVSLVVGKQQIAVARSQIQAVMKTGPAMLPSPRLAMLEAVEATQMPELNR
jgi:hypothetical protein